MRRASRATRARITERSERARRAGRGEGDPHTFSRSKILKAPPPPCQKEGGRRVAPIKKAFSSILHNIYSTM